MFLRRDGKNVDIDGRGGGQGLKGKCNQKTSYGKYLFLIKEKNELDAFPHVFHFFLSSLFLHKGAYKIIN